MNKRKEFFIYRFFVIASLFLGIVLSFKNTTFVRYLLSYYTTQSNLVCLVVFLFLEVADIVKYNYRNKKWYPILKGAITIAILITFVIYLSTLVPNDFPMYSVSLKTHITSKKIGNLLVHGISPLLVVGDYFFDEKGKLQKNYPIYWMILPILYLFFAYSGKGHFYGIGGSREYGYFFLDPKKVGETGVIIWIIGIAMGILLVSYTWIIIDKKLAKKEQKKKQEK